MVDLGGYIKTYRKMLSWEWYKDVPTKVLFLHLLLTASFKDGRYMGYEVKAGQCIVGRRALAKQTGLTEQQVRTALKRLEKTGEITLKPTHLFTVITIENWALYQTDSIFINPRSNHQATHHQPTSNPPSTTSKECKESKNDKNVNSIYIAAVEEIVDYLNETTSSNYRCSTKSTINLISARLKDGYSVDDIKLVIWKKSKEWLGTEYQKYLTPQTLFGNNFEKYLEQKIADAPEKTNKTNELNSFYDMSKGWAENEQN